MIDWVNIKEDLYLDQALITVLDSVFQKTVEGMGSGYVIDPNQDKVFKLFEELKASRIYFKDANSFAYLPSNRVYTDDSCLEKLGVRSTRIGKLLSILMDCDVDSKLCNFAVSVWREQLNTNEASELTAKIEILDDPHSAYKKSTNSRLHSCMTGRSYPRFYKLISTRNEDRKVKIAVLKDDQGFIIGRALVWFNVSVAKIGEVCQKKPVKITVMDRIYSVGDSSDLITTAFKKYAKENGWYHRYYQSTEKQFLFVSPEGKQTELALVFKTRYELLNLNETLKSFTGFPYLDTFNRGSGNCLMNYSPGKGYKISHQFVNTEGRFSTCYICDSCGSEKGFKNDLYNLDDEQICLRCMTKKGYSVCSATGVFSKDHSQFVYQYDYERIVSLKFANQRKLVFLDSKSRHDDIDYKEVTSAVRVIELEGFKFDQSYIPIEYRHLACWSDYYYKWLKVELSDKFKYFSSLTTRIVYSMMENKDESGLSEIRKGIKQGIWSKVAV